MLDRDVLISTLAAALEPLPYAQAAWLGGSFAFGRADTRSDVDMQVIVEPDRVDDTFAVAEAALEALSPFARTYHVPMPSWHGHAQRFYQLRDADPFHMVDLVVQRLDAPNDAVERERHGVPVVLFDKRQLLGAVPIDKAAFMRRLEARLADLSGRFPMFQSLVEKEVERGDRMGALSFYHSLTLRPLVELLRIRHDPYRHDFGFRYLAHDLPADIAAEVADISYVGDISEIPAKRLRAERRFDATLAELRERGIQLK